MMNFTLEVQFDSRSMADLKNSNTQLVLSRNVTSNPASNGVSLAWFAMSPMVNNTISWTEAYFLYVSNMGLKEPQPVIVRSSAMAQTGRLIEYSEDSGFQLAASEAEEMVAGYGLLNVLKSSDSTSFGLAQAITVNAQDQGVLALNVKGLESGQQVWFKPDATVLVSLATELSTGAILPQPGVASIILNFDANTPHQRLFYDSASQIFSVI